MRLKVCLPTEVLLNREVAKIVTAGENGSFASFRTISILCPPWRRAF